VSEKSLKYLRIDAFVFLTSYSCPTATTGSASTNYIYSAIRIPINTVLLLIIFEHLTRLDLVSRLSIRCLPNSISKSNHILEPCCSLQPQRSRRVPKRQHQQSLRGTLAVTASVFQLPLVQIALVPAPSPAPKRAPSSQSQAVLRQNRSQSSAISFKSAPNALLLVTTMILKTDVILGSSSDQARLTMRFITNIRGARWVDSGH
jgi:hypothetical protein